MTHSLTKRSKNTHTTHTLRCNSLIYFSSCRPLEIASNTSKESHYSLLPHRGQGSSVGVSLWHEFAILVNYRATFRRSSTTTPILLNQHPFQPLQRLLHPTKPSPVSLLRIQSHRSHRQCSFQANLFILGPPDGSWCAAERPQLRRPQKWLKLCINKLSLWKLDVYCKVEIKRVLLVYHLHVMSMMW
jgi:hypothetical protein